MHRLWTDWIELGIHHLSYLIYCVYAYVWFMWCTCRCWGRAQTLLVCLGVHGSCWCMSVWCTCGYGGKAWPLLVVCGDVHLSPIQAQSFITQNPLCVQGCSHLHLPCRLGLWVNAAMPPFLKKTHGFWVKTWVQSQVLRHVTWILFWPYHLPCFYVILFILCI